jgi:hypothetical protein
MHAGDFNKLVTVLGYVDNAWEACRETWINVEYVSKVIFSPLAAGGQGYKVTARRYAEPTQHQALRIDGNHCMITAVRRQLMYVDIDVAIIVPKQFTLRRQNADIGTFYGALAERFVSWTQQTPGAKSETGMLLVTPKAVELRAGDIVVGAAGRFSVRECHVADDYHNDYEIIKVGDA